MLHMHLLLLAIMLCLLPDTGSAEVYSYKDEKGNIHFSDSVHAVPKRYRDQLQIDESAEALLQEDTEPSQTEPSWNISELLMPSTDRWVEEVDNGLRPRLGRTMTPGDKRKMKAFYRDWSGSLFYTSVVSWVVLFVLLIHAFATHHPIWGVLNLLLPFPTNFLYTLINFANEKIALKFLFLAVQAAIVFYVVQLIRDFLPVFTEITSNPIYG